SRPLSPARAGSITSRGTSRWARCAPWPKPNRFWAAQHRRPANGRGRIQTRAYREPAPRDRGAVSFGANRQRDRLVRMGFGENEWQWTPYVAVLFGFDPDVPKPSFSEWERAIFIDDVPKLHAAVERAV